MLGARPWDPIDAKPFAEAPPPEVQAVIHAEVSVDRLHELTPCKVPMLGKAVLDTYIDWSSVALHMRDSFRITPAQQCSRQIERWQHRRKQCTQGCDVGSTVIENLCTIL